jgi:hypothetical protein
MSIGIDEYKNIINSEFAFSESYDTADALNKSFSPGTIILTPNPKLKQRPWLRKALDEWNRGGRTILLVTPFRTSCKYFQEYLTKHAEIRVITASLSYNQQAITRPMILAIFKAKPGMQLNHLVTFD